MADSTGLHLSTVVMHHPSRADRLPDLLAALEGLEPRVVTDPDPEGPPSPLRTAKRAWAAIAPGATHHLVVQDDVRPVPGFADLVRRAVAARPDRAVSLYVNWNSPQNAYRVRRAAAAGLPFADLCDLEYTPTLGLVLPAAAAAGLASHLAALPDHLREDDEMVTPYRRSTGLGAVATVPSLLDHGSGSSLAGNAAHGARHAVVFDTAAPPDGHWTSAPGTGLDTAGRTAADRPDHAVELTDSTCRIRLLRPLGVEPVEHPFGWPWYDWCTLLGVDRGRVVATWRAAGRREPRPELALELWAACYLLGVDVRTDPAGRPTPYLAGALDSWIASGLSAADRTNLSAADREALRSLGRLAFRTGRTDAGAAPQHPTADPTSLEAVHG
ncbi:hypothetical protein ACFV6F_37455 [Kitasatospora phosalacinea]|uniref:hypothetical protein n=1 Tax=Kitasatospora phosalacinea TaxID=2065 RepID=UPI00365FDD6E